MGEAAFLLLRKTLAPEATDMGTTAALILLGLLMFLPPALYEMDWSLFRQAGPAQWAAVVYFGVVFTGVAYFLWFRGVSKAPGHVAGVFTAVMPMSAVGLSWLILDEPVLWNHLAGGVFVLGAIGLMTIGGQALSSVGPAACQD
jgi:drug/metabolite transporter (DMT)-like permease